MKLKKNKELSSLKVVKTLLYICCLFSLIKSDKCTSSNIWMCYFFHSHTSNNSTLDFKDIKCLFSGYTSKKEI